MKSMYLLIITFLISENLCSQTLLAVDSMPVKGKLIYNLYDSAKFKGKNNNGSIYQLPLDGMLAFKPDSTITSNMPVQNFQKQSFTLLQKKQPRNPLILPYKQSKKRIPATEFAKPIIIHR